MKVVDIYHLFVSEGIKADARSQKQISAYLASKKSEYNKLTSLNKKLFDKESFYNPYADTRILCGDVKRTVRRMLVGIDVETQEILLAEQMALRGRKIDLVLAHHPEGMALAGLHEVMHMQSDLLYLQGLDADVAKKLMKKRIDEVSRGLHAINHTRAVDAAELMGMSYMCCHTPSDNHVNTYLQKLVDRKKPKRLKDLIDLLMKEPEYQDARINKAGPEVLAGEMNNLCGKIVVDMTGGTEGSKEIFARLSQAGVKTYLGMHLSNDHFERVKSEFINVVIAGHIASDNLGMNLLLDKLVRKADVEIIPCSGFRRIKR